jgi:hypothetical protein
LYLVKSAQKSLFSKNLSKLIAIWLRFVPSKFRRS